MSCLVTNYTSTLTKLPFENPGYTHEYDIIEVLYVLLDLVTCIEQVIVVVDSQLSKYFNIKLLHIWSLRTTVSKIFS